MKKRVLSVVLAVLMMLNIFGIMAFSLSYDDITFISIKDVVAPIAGKKPSYTYTNNGSNYHFCDEYEGDNGGAVKNCMEWYDITAQKGVLPTDTFLAGHEYSASFYIIADDGYWFPEIINEIYINGIDARGQFLGMEVAHSFRYYVSVEFPAVDEIISSIAVTGVTAPAKGAKPAYNATVASSAPYTVRSTYTSGVVKNGVEWFDVTAQKSVKATDTFQTGHKYSASVYLRAKDGYAFPSVYLGDATVNGKAANQVAPADVMTMDEYVEDIVVVYEFPAIADDTKPISFPDVKKTDWFYNPVMYCAQKGYVKGYSDGRFGPADSLSRQDFVIIIARIAGANLKNYKTCKLKDVDMSAYYGPAVAWATSEHIINGYADGRFGVGDPITREQVAVILYSYLGKPATGSQNILSAYTDRGRISEFAQSAMIWAVNNGVITGKDAKTLAPTDTASRAEIATIITRMDQKGML